MICVFCFCFEGARGGAGFCFETSPSPSRSMPKTDCAVRTSPSECVSKRPGECCSCQATSEATIHALRTLFSQNQAFDLKAPLPNSGTFFPHPILERSRVPTHSSAVSVACDTTLSIVHSRERDQSHPLSQKVHFGIRKSRPVSS